LLSPRPSKHRPEMSTKILPVDEGSTSTSYARHVNQAKTLNTYRVWFLFDLLIVCGTMVLGVCYAWARHLGHVGTFCDISDLVVHLPERILFRLNFALIGTILAVIALPIHDVVSSRLKASQSKALPKIAASAQVVSGVGVILVASCGPEEIMAFHIFSAVLGFGGSALAQLLYNAILFTEEKASSSAKTLHRIRCLISCFFFACVFGIVLADVTHVLPYDPFGHIFEWGLWLCLLLWYSTFRFDLSTLVLASMEVQAA